MNPEVAELLAIIHSLSTRCATLAREKAELQAHFQGVMARREAPGEDEARKAHLREVGG